MAVYPFNATTADGGAGGAADGSGGSSAMTAWSCSPGCQERWLGNMACDLACNTSACLWDQVPRAPPPPHRRAAAACPPSTCVHAPLPHPPETGTLAPAPLRRRRGLPPCPQSAHSPASRAPHHRASVATGAGPRSRRCVRRAAQWIGSPTGTATRRASTPHARGTPPIAPPPRRAAPTVPDCDGTEEPSMAQHAIGCALMTP